MITGAQLFCAVNMRADIVLAKDCHPGHVAAHGGGVGFCVEILGGSFDYGLRLGLRCYAVALAGYLDGPGIDLLLHLCFGGSGRRH